ncbi:hypothetical protein [Chryseobacterium aquifrigidense]|uniref:Uncharacterized protein n=1 Tax=Chryseobacterium aquifrigidense TaxID=558021 RepID=A0A543EA04_9FLAO|nr:hypothetical protein [Chryseobacterium aquifrigidense]TQM18309.1 hypothetical protein FB551_4090 [Chryseobacterium aquifrigidense]
MKELEELTREIREKLPRLKELSKGCIIESSEKVFEIDDLMYAVCYNDQIFDRFTDSWVFSDEYTIIGKEPMLNDVLQWFKESDMKDGINMMHELIWSHTAKEIINHWNLSKPYLKDQSPELIKFLHSLLKTKQ